MAREHREVFILLGYWHLPVAGVSGQGREHPGILWGIYAFTSILGKGYASMTVIKFSFL